MHVTLRCHFQCCLLMFINWWIAGERDIDAISPCGIFFVWTDWIANPNPSNFIIERGHLLVIAHSAGGLSKAGSRNIFRLLKPIPNSDWSITAEFTVKFRTAREDFSIGLIDDAKNYLVARFYAYDQRGSGLGV